MLGFIFGPCMNLVIAVSIVVPSTESCSLLVLHVLSFQTSSERIYSDLALKVTVSTETHGYDRGVDLMLMR